MEASPPGHQLRGAKNEEKGKERKEKERKKRERKKKRKKTINGHDEKGVIQAQAGAPPRCSREENFRGAKLTAAGGGGGRAPFFKFAPGHRN